MKYDLRFEPWIEVEYLDGTKESIGFQRLFEEAHYIRDFHHDNPLAEAALMRILIALSHRILNGPPDKKVWKAAYERGCYEKAAVEAYFEKWSDRFDLFDEQYPFMQVSGLKMTDKEGAPLSGNEIPTLDLLLHHIATGNNATLFDHGSDLAPKAYLYSEAAYVLLIAQFYSLGGIHKKSTNLCKYQGNCKNSVLVNGLSAYVMADTIFETLMLNTLIIKENYPIPNTTDDTPFWENPDYSSGDTVPKGYLDYLTFTGRLIRLVPQEDGKTKSLHFACGRSLNADVRDPFAPVKIEKNKEKRLGASLERALWRDSDTLFRYSDEGFTIAPLQHLANVGRKISTKAYRIVVYGLVNDKANPKRYIKETLPVPLALLENPTLRNEIEFAISFAEKGYKKLDGALKSFSDATEVVKDMLKNTASVTYWSRLELPFKNFLHELDLPEAMERWEKSVQQAANEAFERAVKPLLGHKARFLEAYVLSQRKLYLKKGGKS